MKSIIRIIKNIFVEISNQIEKDDVKYKYTRDYKNNYKNNCVTYKKC